MGMIPKENEITYLYFLWQRYFGDIVINSDEKCEDF